MAKARLLLLGLFFAGASFLGGHAAQASTKRPVHYYARLHVARRHSHFRLASSHHSYMYYARLHVARRHSHFRLASSHHSYMLRHRLNGHVEFASSQREYDPGHESWYHRHEYGVRLETAEYRERHFHHFIHYIRYARYRHSHLECVPYAREVSHIDITGNAFLWWAKAAGRYARGNVPEEGAVLNFRAIPRMPLGHVAVVTDVIDSRTILVTQANWIRGSITNDVTVQDVSPNNNWTDVEVELGDSSKWGAPYPTYGFIYNQEANGVVVAASGQGDEVAEAPAVPSVSAEAPDRALQ